MKLRIASFALLAAFVVSAQQNRRAGQSNITVPVPSDPHELVAGGAHTPATVAERGAALAMLQQTLENTRFHQVGTPPFRMDVSFIASGDSSQSGQGDMTETWLSGRAWQWSAHFGGYSVVRGASSGPHAADRAGGVPMRLHMLRNAIFFPVYDVAVGAQIRTAPVQWNGKPATCVMTSGVVAPESRGRLWEEVEYCFDNASGLLEISSFAPGAYTVYSYSKNQVFHGRSLPDHITIFEGGKEALDANFQISDAGPVDPATLEPTPSMSAAVDATLSAPSRQPFSIPYPGGSRVQPLMVHANVVNGTVLSAEVIAASDSSLSAQALEFVKGMHMGATGAQQQIYFNVKFVPQSPLSR